jgi:outer membrane protein
MNNKVITIILSVLSVAVIVLSIVVFTKSEKVAYIDTGKLLEQSKEMQSLKKQLEKDQAAIKGNVDTLTLEFQDELKKYEKDQVRMSPKEKQLSQELLRSKQQQLMQYQQAIQQKVQGDEQKRTQEILTTINAKIKEYGESKGYKLIFATAGGNIAYGDKGVDITEEIVKLINN